MSIEDIKKYYSTRHSEKGSQTLEDMLFQAGKTQFGSPVDPSVLDKITIAILRNLNIDMNDQVIDLGCANGLITKMVAQHVKSVRGFDLSDSHIDYAIKFNNRDNIEYNLSDIFEVKFDDKKYSKIYMYEVLQHFEYSWLRELLNKISIQHSTFSLFIGSIPDAQKLLDFYHTDEYKKFYFKEVLENKSFHIGNWWFKEHILTVCQDLELDCEILDQDTTLHTHYYRFDALIRKESK